MSPLATEPRFYEDVYRTELDVWVDAIEADARFGSCLVLGETLCHPHGGGQKGDRATLLLPAEDAAALGLAGGEAAPAEGDAALSIVDTRRVEGRILHVLGTPLDPAAAEGVLVGSHPYRLRLDWGFRWQQMRLHSAAHLLHCFVERVLGHTVRFPETSDLQPDYGLNRYEQKELLTPMQLEEVLRQLNAFNAEGHAIRTDPDPERAGFRHWRCEGWEIPCGGTHPANTREIGPVQAELSLKRGRTSLIFRLAEP